MFPPSILLYWVSVTRFGTGGAARVVSAKRGLGPLSSQPTSGHSWAHQWSCWCFCQSMFKKGQNTAQAVRSEGEKVWGTTLEILRSEKKKGGGDAPGTGTEISLQLTEKAMVKEVSPWSLQREPHWSRYLQHSPWRSPRQNKVGTSWRNCHLRRAHTGADSPYVNYRPRRIHAWAG